ncbi:MAG: hypothetical protein M1168_03240 [Candidatus Marsarchaeota archaeon]|jgi:hypothetical protein|nr:hypothetical protein [Candidatus Marsarchaeota archaeon]MCL5094970.1 hypothetical protein [Candidatus Marsarchaeota archaeon]
MAKTDNSKSKNIPYLPIIIILVLVVIGVGFLYIQKSSAYSQEIKSYSNLNSNYTSFKTQSQNQLSSLQTQISTLQTQLTQNKTLYQNAENNLTNPYQQVLYDQKTINLPRFNYTYTYNDSGYNSSTGLYSGFDYIYNYTWGRFNYTFNAPYAGYIIFNATSTIINNPNPSTCAWIVYESNKLGWRNVSVTTETLYNTTYTYTDHFAGNDRLFVNLTNAPFDELCPVQSVTYDIPVNKGINYLIIDNDNSSQGITITFSAKYIGYHTS